MLAKAAVAVGTFLSISGIGVVVAVGATVYVGSQIYKRFKYAKAVAKTQLGLGVKADK